ncbi:MAG: PIN domain-containing protein [Candidatus Caldarchaeales archaeon]
MIETDILYSLVKKEDWLKPVAEKVINMIVRGKLGQVYTSREVIHELYYVSIEEGVTINEYIRRAAALTSISNLIFLETTYEIDLLALTLMKQYKLESIFDAYYAATCLNMVKDHTIISTYEPYDRIPGINRIDPRDLKF